MIESKTREFAADVYRHFRALSLEAEGRVVFHRTSIET